MLFPDVAHPENCFEWRDGLSRTDSIDGKAKAPGVLARHVSVLVSSDSQGSHPSIWNLKGTFKHICFHLLGKIDHILAIFSQPY